jgi:hypothetical protein
LLAGVSAALPVSIAPAVLHFFVLVLIRACWLCAVNADPREWASAGTWLSPRLAAIPLRLPFCLEGYLRLRSVGGFFLSGRLR